MRNTFGYLDSVGAGAQESMTFWQIVALFGKMNLKRMILRVCRAELLGKKWTDVTDGFLLGLGQSFGLIRFCW